MKMQSTFFLILFTTVFATCLIPEGVVQAEPNRPAELQGYWLTKSVVVNGKQDGGEEGSYLIIRADGTYRIAKKGRKPEGSWQVNTNNELVLKIRDQVILRSDWRRDGNLLTLSYEDRGAKIVLKYSKAVLEKEPKAPDE